MQSMNRVPSEAVDTFLEATKAEAVKALQRVLAEVTAGELTTDEAADALEAAVRGSIDAAAVLVDVIADLPSPAEELSDVAIQQGAQILKGLAAKRLAKAVQAVDDAIGYNPRRAARRLSEALEEDLADGTVGDDRVRRVYRISRRITKKSPALAVELAIGFRGNQLLVDGTEWGEPPKRFAA